MHKTLINHPQLTIKCCMTIMFLLQNCLGFWKPNILQTCQQSDQKLMCILLLVAFEQRTKSSNRMKKCRGENRFTSVTTSFAI